MLQLPPYYILRHGQTEWNAAGRHQGQLDSPLTAKGEQQGKDQGTILSRLDVDWSDYDAFTSPQLRAARTAGFALGPIGKTATKDDRLKEVAFGAWEGKTPDDIEKTQPGFLKARDDDVFGIHFHSPGGETFDQMCARVMSFLMELKRPSIIVCHGITSRVARGLTLGLDQAGMSDLEGGQGCVYHVADGVHSRLDL